MYLFLTTDGLCCKYFHSYCLYHLGRPACAHRLILIFPTVLKEASAGELCLGLSHAVSVGVYARCETKKRPTQITLYRITLLTYNAGGHLMPTLDPALIFIGDFLKVSNVTTNTEHPHQNGTFHTLTSKTKMAHGNGRYQSVVSKSKPDRAVAQTAA